MMTSYCRSTPDTLRQGEVVLLSSIRGCVRDAGAVQRRVHYSHAASRSTTVSQLRRGSRRPRVSGVRFGGVYLHHTVDPRPGTAGDDAATPAGECRDLSAT